VVLVLENKRKNCTSQMAEEVPDYSLNEDIDPQACVVCTKLVEQPMQCSACKQAIYCGAACQREDWDNGHSEQCSLVGVRRRGQLAPRRRAPRRGRGAFFPRRRYRGRTGRWLWRSLFGGLPWYRPGYYNYWRRWYPDNYYYPALDARPERPPELPPFNPTMEPETIDKKLQQLRRQYAGYAQRTGYTIVPDYEQGRYRWAAS
jgi:hypothetical protein